jgi:hypothetical protein
MVLHGSGGGRRRMEEIAQMTDGVAKQKPETISGLNRSLRG